MRYFDLPQHLISLQSPKVGVLSIKAKPAFSISNIHAPKLEFSISRR